MVGEQVAREPDAAVFDLEVLPQEPEEVGQEFGIRVGELDGVSRFRAFGPIEHAAGGIRRVAFARQSSACLLVTEASFPCGRCLPLRGDEGAQARFLE
jgi:hypothetical protein